jgi:hypothetical protein
MTNTSSQACHLCPILLINLLLSFFQELFTDTLEEGGRGREREGEREL